MKNVIAWFTSNFSWIFSGIGVLALASFFTLCSKKISINNGKTKSKNKESIDWYMEAAKNGNAQAQCKLGDYYESGLVVAQNYEKAIEWYKKAAEGGNTQAQCKLGDYTKDQKEGNSYKPFI